AVFDDGRIDVEHHGHLAGLARRHGLFGEAEAIDLLEILADGQRRYIVGRLPGRGPRRLVGDGIVDGNNIADPGLDLGFFRLELPGQSAGDVGIETYRDLAGERRSGGCRFRDLGGTVETGSAAEPVVERHRGVGRADHQHYDE